MKTLLLAASLSTPSPQPGDLRPRVREFVEVMNKFVKDLYGCPPGRGLAPPGSCREGQARLDVKEFEAARKKAAELFDLRYPEGRKKKK